MAQTPEQKATAKAKKEAEKAAIAHAAAAAPSADNTAPAVVPNAEPAPEPETAAKGDIVVKYRDHKGEPTERTFSKEVHGKDFAKLADEFKATNVARIIA